jgi:hypothetical protein
MNWQAIGAVGELLGAIVVLASLVFVAIQIRHNTQTLRLGVSEEANRSFAVYAAMFTQPGISRLYRVGLASPGELDEDELITFNALMSTLFNWLAHVHTLRASGIAWQNPQGIKATTLYVLRQPGGLQWWNRFRVTYDDSFQAYTDSLLSDLAG